MDNVFKFLIPGRPIPWKRPGQTKNRRYDEQTKEKELYRLHIMAQFGNEELITGPVAIEAHYYFERPKGHFTKKGNVKKNTPLYHVVKPDVDNLDKFLFDVLTGCIFVDDIQVIRSNTAKGYLHKSVTQLTVKSLKARYL